VGENYLAVCRHAVGEDADIARAALAGIQAVLDGSETRFSLEYPCHSSRQQRWFLLHVTPLMNGHSGGVVSHINITERKQTEDEKERLLEAVSAQSQQLRTLSARLAEAEEAERKQLARELHDQVGQNLTAVGLNLSIIREAIYDALPQADAITGRLDDSLALVEEITDRIRDVMANLRPPVLDDYGLVAALDWYGARFSKWADLVVSVQGQEPSPRLAAAIENALFRIAQEALTNTARHARASRVVVRVEVDNGLVRLVVADDGIGFEPAGPAEFAGRQSWGLLSMSERAEAVGGSCRVISRPNQGTQVIVEVSR
jgi:two-component system sensor histidine kinase UhpB